MYDLFVCGVTTASDQKNAILIGKTLLKLPKKVREKVLDAVCFIITGDAEGTVFKFHLPVEKTFSFILLNFTLMKEKIEDEKMRTVAHEIAHFILGHGIDSKGGKKAEKTADDLIEKWGFKRAYQSYGRFATVKKE